MRIIRLTSKTVRIYEKVLLFIAILFFFDRFGQAQSLTIEYNIGHGSYQMSDMKDILKIRCFLLPMYRLQIISPVM